MGLLLKWMDSKITVRTECCNGANDITKMNLMFVDELDVDVY